MPMKAVNPDLISYVQGHIIPIYNGFDSAHGISHAEKVIANSLSLASLLNEVTDINMVYAIAAYHDVGLIGGRQGHEKASAIFLARDEALKHWFSPGQITTMAQAVEDHRASNDYEPRSIYGKIVAEADRDIDYDTILTRTVQYSVENYPHYNPQQHFTRCRDHIYVKYGQNGYLKLWLEAGKNRQGLEEIRLRLKDTKGFREDFYTKLRLHYNNQQ